MKEEMSLDNVTVKKGAELIDQNTSKVITVKEDMTVNRLMSSIHGHDYEADFTTIVKTESKNLKIDMNGTVYLVRKREYDIPDVEKKQKKVEDDIENLGDAIDIPFDKELTPKQQRKADRKAKRKRKKEIRKRLKQMKKDDEVDTKEYRQLEDELLALEGYQKPGEEEEELKGKDMFDVAEQFEDDINKLPAKLKILVTRGLKLKKKLDAIEERFGKRYCRMYRKDFRARYGKNFRDENYGEVFKGFLDLGSEEVDEVEEEVTEEVPKEKKHKKVVEDLSEEL